jgi:hypothetical protein
MKAVYLSILLLALVSMPLFAQPVITQQPTNEVVTNGGTTVFSVTVSNAGPFSYQWQFNGVNLPTNGIITTMAGNGNNGYSGDGGAATSARLNQPQRVALDSHGNLFIADTFNNRVRKVDTNGIITTVAGGGSESLGDGGAATNATLNEPYGMAVDSTGNLLITDTYNYRLRKVDTNGIITTAAGNGTNGYSGDGGLATKAMLSGPSGVAVDSYGNLFIADLGNNRIRKVDTYGIITTVAGNGTNVYSGDGGAATNASLYMPWGLAVDNHGNLFIADTLNNRVRMVDTNGIITTIAGEGPSYPSGGGYSGDGGAATNVMLWEPCSVSVDSYGNLFFADYNNSRVREVWPNGNITTVAGNGTNGYSGDGGAANKASLNSPSGVAVDSYGNLFIADGYNYRIRKVVRNPAYSPVFSTLTIGNISVTNAGNYSVVISGAGGSITSSIVTLTVEAPPVIVGQPASQMAGVGSNPNFSVAVLGSGPFGYALYFCGTNLVQSGTNGPLTLFNISKNDTGSYTVLVTNGYGSVTSQVAMLTVVLPPKITSQPAGQTNVTGTTVNLNVTADGIGPFTYQWALNRTNLPNNIITTVAGNGTNGYSGDGSAATNAMLGSPAGVAVDGCGNLIIGDKTDNCIRQVDTNSIITTVAGNGTNGYSGDGGNANKAMLSYPSGVALDNYGDLFIADTYNGRIRKVDTQGIIITWAGGGLAGNLGDGGVATNATLSYPYGVAVDGYGNLFIADLISSRIRKVDANGIITTVAGNGTRNYSGDGGAATNATLRMPYGVALDTHDNLFITDTGNQRVRKVDTNGIVTTVAGNGTAAYSGDGSVATNASLSGPWAVAVDSNGNLFIADQQNNRIREVDINGVITTVAGNGTGGYSGDGSVATNAWLDHPAGVALDRCGNLFIADQQNSRIREVHFAGFPTLVLTNINAANAGNYSVVVSSPYGSVTSSVASLVLLLPPQGFTGQAVNPGGNSQLALQFTGTPNYLYILQSATKLTPPVVWQPVLTNPADANGLWQFTDTNLTGGQKYYRAVAY